MAAHAARRIVDAVLARLADLATTRRNVFPSAVYAIAEQDLPALRVYANEDTGGFSAFGASPLYTRELVVVVECCAKLAAFDAQLFAMRTEVENALGADLTLGGLARTLELRTADPDRSGEGDLPIGVLRLSFVVRYQYAANAADVPR
jgi:hypothetical protein